jgi:hypothetical protein
MFTAAMMPASAAWSNICDFLCLGVPTAEGTPDSRARLLDQHGREREWRSQTIQAYKRLTKPRHYDRFGTTTFQGQDQKILQIFFSDWEFNFFSGTYCGWGYGTKRPPGV